MRNGHYTLRDISELTIVPRDNVKGTAQYAYGTLPDGTVILSDGLTFTVRKSLDDKKLYNYLDQVPSIYRTAAKIIAQKGTGRGGHRFGAGRKSTHTILTKKEPHTFRLTNLEYIRVKEFIDQMRKDN